jgi:hypothetical protein
MSVDVLLDVRLLALLEPFQELVCNLGHQHFDG